MTVVKLHERPSLDDIPGRLKWLAHEIEVGNLIAESVLVLIPTSGVPNGYNFGECMTFAQRVALLELTKQDLIADYLRATT